jgi:hypothetical protein
MAGARMSVTDTDYLLAALADGRWHNLNELLRRSFTERGCGLTVHSRVSDLRKYGHCIQHRTVKGARRGEASEYRLLRASLEQATVATTPSPAAVASSSERPLAETGVTKAAAEPHHAPVSASEQLALSGGAFRRTAA